MVVVFLLTVLATSTGCSFVDDAVGRSPNGPATRVANTTPTSIDAAGTPTPEPDWYSSELIAGGFHVDIPSVLSPDHGVYINDQAGELITYGYTGRPARSALLRVAAQAHVIVQYSAHITTDNICPSGGTLVTLGEHLHGYQRSDAPPEADGPQAIYAYVRVNTVLNGEAVQLELNAPGPTDSFFARYGDIWQHMLASFGPLPNQPTASTHVCG